jgi:hypothetical protein
VDWTKIWYEQNKGQGAFMDASQETYRLVTGAVYSGNITPISAKYQNYSYSLTFPGPRYRCGDVEDQALFDELELNSFQTLSNASRSPAVTGRGEHTFDLWFFTSTRNFSCQTWNATYTANFSCINGVQQTEITNVRNDHRLVPASGFAIGPGYGDVPEIIGSAGWNKALSSLITGAINVAGVMQATFVTSQVLQTALAGCPELQNVAELTQSPNLGCPGGSLERGIENISENVTMCFLGRLPSL